ncbi:hypothetical protein ACFO0N_11920 [Halobium salinum]|uniref:Uncharacterized protein n=1 Tax=Halobium salinum TaxID=1364940 RepID=A0ABD5PDC0_9EURY|nr:hypothetical protein [Halobium salinum]
MTERRRRDRRRGRDGASDRAQLSLSVVEAGVGVVFVLAVAAGFGLGVPTANTQEAQLDAYAEDTATVLSREPPRHAGATRLSEVARSERAFERERDALERRVDRILTDNLLFRVSTPHGAVGFRRPVGVPTGEATVTTLHGDVTVRVWYA